MQVSFKNNFENFNLKQVDFTNQSTKNLVTTIKVDDKLSKSNINTAGMSPQGIGGLVAIALTLVGAIKYRKNIGNFFKKIVKPAETKEASNKAKEHVKQIYNKYVNRDVILEDIEAVHNEYVRYGMEHWPNGILYYGQNCKGKEKAIEDLVQFLKKQDWDVERIPLFDISKAEPIMKEGNYNSNYLQKIIKSFQKAAQKYNETGKRTAFVIRGIDKFTGPRSGKFEAKEAFRIDFTDCLLAPIEYLRKNGCTIITDCTDIHQIDRALGRFGRFDRRIPIRPLAQDSRDIWNQYLTDTYKSYSRVKKEQLETQKVCGYDYTYWCLQNAIDVFPEQYRESCELYQKLKDTKFYPFEL